MKALLKFIISIALLGSICMTAIIAANYGHFDSGIRYALQHYLSLKGIENKIYNLRFKQGVLFIEKITISVGEVNFVLEEINSNMSFILSNFEYTAGVTIDRISAYIKADSQSDQEIINYDEDGISTRLSANIKILPFRSYNNISLNLSNITMPEFDIKSGIAEIKIERQEEASDIISIVNLRNDSFLHNSYYSTSAYDFNSQAGFKNLPVQFLRYIKKLLPEDDLCEFLSLSLQEGIIEKGEYSISASKEDYKNNRDILENLSANLVLKDGVFEYHPNMPKIRNLNLNAKISSSSAILTLSKADIAGFDFEGVVVDVDLSPDSQKGECGRVVARGSGKGKASDLTKFISPKIMEDIQKSGIDLSKITGNSKVDLFLKLPLGRPENMDLSVEADIPSTDLDILDGRVALRKAALKAKLQNNILAVRGGGIINGFNSEIDFSCNTDEEISSDPHLKITSNLFAVEGKIRNPIFSVFDKAHGKAVLNFEYYIKNGRNYFTINSMLENIELSLSKLGINKKIGKKANLEIIGEIDAGSKALKDQASSSRQVISNYQAMHSLEFKIIGDDSLDIQGESKFNGDEFHLDIKNLRSNQTDLKAQIYYAFDKASNKSKLDVSFAGKALDLHNFSLDEFFANNKFLSPKQTSQTTLEAKIDSVLLRDNIWLDSLSTEFTCDHIRCFKGFLKSSVGSRLIELDLKKSQDMNTEIWKIKTTNAGAALKAIGIYSNMKAGMLDLEVIATREEVSKSAARNKYLGNFSLKKFTLSDTPLLSRIVSFGSLPGFLNAVTNNTDILFWSMDGEFTLANNMLTVKEAMATGPYFDFSLSGKVNLDTKYLDIHGHVTPELYGFSSIVKNVPFLGDFVTGSKSSAGLISTPYSIKQSY